MSIHLIFFRFFSAPKFVKISFFLGLLLLGFQTKATHIFGGHLKMTQLDAEAGRFKVSVLIYVDVGFLTPFLTQDLLNGVADIPIFAKKDNRQIIRFKVPYSGFKSVIYDNPSCAEILKLQTQEYLYETEISLNLNDFTDPDGYYMSFDLCCRNQILSNIANPIQTGYIFYTEFPALLEGTEPVIFSTPTFPILNGDYICANKLFTYDFSAIDPDGDELRYSLVWPFNDFNINSVTPPTRAGPYPLITWAGGASLANIIPGPIPLSINPKTGILSVKAKSLGIYAFSVQVEKFRNGVKIGSVRHDFQLPVVDCAVNTPPVPIITVNNTPVKEVEICAGEKITLETANNAQWAFQWQKDGDNIAKANASQLLINEVGKYSVVKSLTKQCVNDTTSGIVLVKYKKNVEATITGPSKPICLGDSMLLASNSSVNNAFEWFYKGLSISKQDQIYVKKEGVYTLKEKGFCNSPLDSLDVTFLPLPVLPNPSAPVSICLRDTTVLTFQSKPNWTFDWFRSQKNLNQPNVLSLAVRDTGNYYVQVSDALGCKNLSKAYRVNLKDDCQEALTRLFIPDIFSPNADGINDTWQIRNLDLNSESIVTIFNRWGEVVYYSDNYSASPWDGRYNGQIVSTGVYAYTIQFPKSKYTMRGQLMVAY